MKLWLKEKRFYTQTFFTGKATLQLTRPSATSFTLEVCGVRNKENSESREGLARHIKRPLSHGIIITARASHQAIQHRNGCLEGNFLIYFLIALSLNLTVLYSLPWLSSYFWRWAFTPKRLIRTSVALKERGLATTADTSKADTADTTHMADTEVNLNV